MTDTSASPAAVTPSQADEIPSTAWRPRSTARKVTAELLRSLLAGAISLVVAVVALRISPTDLIRRWTAGGDDSILGYTLFTSATQHFSFGDNVDLGFPHGLNVFFSAQVDPSTAVALSVMALFIHNGILLMNVFWLLTFIGTGISGYFFFRALRIHPWLSVLFGTIFSLAPFHFIRIFYGHTFLANYWAIPLAGILLLTAAGPATDPFRRWAESATTSRAQLVRRIVPAAVLGLLIASSGSYYFVFAVIVVGGVWGFSVLRALVRRDRVRSLVGPTIALVPLGFFVVVELFLLGRGYGERYAPYFTKRSPIESELYAGKLVSLLLPWNGSRFPILDSLGVRYNTKSSILTTTEAPGTPILASIGLCLLTASIVVVLVAGPGGLRATWFGRLVNDSRTRMLAPAMVWTFLFFIVTGLGIVVAVAIGPQVRAWSRISILLVLIGLAFTAVLVQRATTRYGIRWILVGLVVVIALLDQVAGVAKAVPLNPTTDQAVASFTAAADKALPDGCGVVQLPVKSFPDSGTIGALQDYDEALPYLYTKSGDLRWSYGSVAGTYGWNVFSAASTPQKFAKAVDVSGACAVEIDLNGYTANPDGWQPLVQAATGTTIPAITSSDKRYLLFPVPGKE